MRKKDNIDNILCRFKVEYDSILPIADPGKIKRTIAASIDAFYENDRQTGMRYFEFLLSQFTWLRKRWWILQSVVLGLIWRILVISGSGDFIRRYIGGLAPLFVMLIVPELWRSQTSDSLEIEGAALYSLRQIYTARMLLFAMADTLLLTVFCGLTAFTVQITYVELITQFFLPLSVTCCICFGFLCSRHANSEYYAIALSILWSTAWIVLILPNSIYETVLPLAGLILTALSLLYLAWLIRRVLLSCDACLEKTTIYQHSTGGTLWN